MYVFIDKKNVSFKKPIIFLSRVECVFKFVFKIIATIIAKNSL